jgi:hypothetical protein
MSKNFFINPMEWQDFLSQDSTNDEWSFELTKDDIKRYCDHVWAEQGFMHSNICCKKCDISKKDWDEFILKEKIKSNTYFV